MEEAHNLALVRHAVEEIWNQGDLAVADVLFASDYMNHAGLIPNLVRGPEAIKISVAFYRTAFPNFQITIDAMTAIRDAVLLRWTAHRSGTLAGGTASATQGTLMGVIVCRFAQGQIAESWMQWNQPGVLDQLGIKYRTGPPSRVPTTAG